MRLTAGYLVSVAAAVWVFLDQQLSQQQANVAYMKAEIDKLDKQIEEIRKIRELTIIVSEQVLSFTMEIADRFLVLDKGRVVYEDTRDKADAAVISRYLSV